MSLAVNTIHQRPRSWVGAGGSSPAAVHSAGTVPTWCRARPGRDL